MILACLVWSFEARESFSMSPSSSTSSSSTFPYKSLDVIKTWKGTAKNVSFSYIDTGSKFAEIGKPSSSYKLHLVSNSMTY